VPVYRQANCAMFSARLIRCLHNRRYAAWRHSHHLVDERNS